MTAENGVTFDFVSNAETNVDISEVVSSVMLGKGGRNSPDVKSMDSKASDTFKEVGDSQRVNISEAADASSQTMYFFEGNSLHKTEDDLMVICNETPLLLMVQDQTERSGNWHFGDMSTLHKTHELANENSQVDATDVSFKQKGMLQGIEPYQQSDRFLGAEHFEAVKECLSLRECRSAGKTPAIGDFSLNSSNSGFQIDGSPNSDMGASVQTEIFRSGVSVQLESAGEDTLFDKQACQPLIRLNDHELPVTEHVSSSSEIELNKQIPLFAYHSKREDTPSQMDACLADEYLALQCHESVVSVPDGAYAEVIKSGSILNELGPGNRDDFCAAQSSLRSNEIDGIDGIGELEDSEYEHSESYSDDDDSSVVLDNSPDSSPKVHADSRPPCPVGLGPSTAPLEPSPRVTVQTRANGTMRQMLQPVEEPANGESENDETRGRLQRIRVKFLRLAHRLGQTPHNVVVAQVLYRLGLAEQLRGSRSTNRAGAFSFDRASAMAVQMEATRQEPLDFSCTIMVLGKSGVGKSATINSIFDAAMFGTNAFELGTHRVQDIIGTVQGIRVRVIDTPGLLPSSADQHKNEKILYSVRRFIKRAPPDIILYFDRLDMQSRDFGDLPLFRTITDVFGSSLWFNAIVVFTHAASAPPEGPNGCPLSYEMFVTQRSHMVQQAIRQAAGDVRLMNPVSLVENHSACRKNQAGQRVLPNGQVWKPQLLLLSFASKILAEANELLKLQDGPPDKLFNAHPRATSLPFLLSSLLQCRPQVKLPKEHSDSEDSMDNALAKESEMEDEEYDKLPPLKCLTRAQLKNLGKKQRKAYYDELDYREKLFMKKQLKEERRQRKLLKKMMSEGQDCYEHDQESSEPVTSATFPLPDLALPNTFDSDSPTYRYRFLDSSSQWLVRPVLDSHGWDHDVGYDGLNVEKLFVIQDKVPVSFSGQVMVDKKEFNMQVEMTGAVKHATGRSSLGLDLQTIGKDVAYTVRTETSFSNIRRNKAFAGLTLTLLGDALSAGLKIGDALTLCRRLKMVMTGGAMVSQSDVAYGGSLEATLMDKEYPLGRTLSVIGLSVMDWHGDLAIGCNIHSQLSVNRATNLTARASLNSKGSGQFSLKIASSEQLQIAIMAIFPLFRSLIRMHCSSQKR